MLSSKYIVTLMGSEWHAVKRLLGFGKVAGD